MSQPRPSQRAEIVARLDEQEAELECLKNTVRGLARIGNVTVSGRCKHCEKSHLLVVNGDVCCPYCRARRTL